MKNKIAFLGFLVIGFGNFAVAQSAEYPPASELKAPTEKVAPDYISAKALNLKLTAPSVDDPRVLRLKSQVMKNATGWAEEQGRRIQLEADIEKVLEAKGLTTKVETLKNELRFESLKLGDSRNQVTVLEKALVEMQTKDSAEITELKNSVKRSGILIIGGILLFMIVILVLFIAHRSILGRRTARLQEELDIKVRELETLQGENMSVRSSNNRLDEAFVQQNMTAVALNNDLLFAREECGRLKKELASAQKTISDFSMGNQLADQSGAVDINMVEPPIVDPPTNVNVPSDQFSADGGHESSAHDVQIGSESPVTPPVGQIPLALQDEASKQTVDYSLRQSAEPKVPDSETPKEELDKDKPTT